MTALNVKYNNDKSRDFTNNTLPAGEPGSDVIASAGGLVNASDLLLLAAGQRAPQLARDRLGELSQSLFYIFSFSFLYLGPFLVLHLLFCIYFVPYYLYLFFTKSISFRHLPETAFLQKKKYLLFLPFFSYTLSNPK